MINSQNNKRVFLTVIFVAILTIIVIGTSFAFFNYTRTGSANTVRTGRINFTSSQDGRINLTNIFPIDPTENGVMDDATKVGTVSITVTGDTTYDKGVEYLVSAVNVNNTVGTKSVPISISATASGTLGTEDEDYFDNREGSTSHIYKVLAKDTISNNDQLMVGYIAKNTTGINGTITIKAYIDKNNIAISDTYSSNGIPTDANGTTSQWVNGRTLFTTEEWNNLQGTGVSFQVKVEANEGIWVEEKLSVNVMSTIPSSVYTYDVGSNIKDIYFNRMDAAEMQERYDAAEIKADLTYNNEGKVLSWLETDENDNNKYIMYIVSDGETYLTTGNYLFYNANLHFAEKIEFNNINTSRVTDMSDMFYSSAVKSLDLTSFDTSNVENMSSFIRGTRYLTDVNMSGLDLRKAKNMNQMFYGNNKLSTLNLSGTQTRDVISMTDMLYGSRAIEEINIEGWGGDNLERIGSLFGGGLEQLKKINIKSFNFGKITDIGGLFRGLENIIEIDLTSVNGLFISNMDSLFDNCKSLTNVNFSNINIPIVTNMSSMFYGCSSLTSLNLSGLGGNNLANVANMFSGCTNLTNLDMSEFNFGSSSLSESASPFYNNEYLKNINLSKANATNVDKMDSMFVGCTNLTDLDMSEFNFGISSLSGLSSPFYNNKYLKNINLSNANISNVSIMDLMFYGCDNLETLILTGIDTSNVTGMTQMFNGCSNLETLVLTGINTSNVTGMEQMFNGCSKLTTLDLSGFDMSKVGQNYYNMFNNCSSLTTIYVSNTWNASSVNGMPVFGGCTSLVGGNGTAFDSSKTDATMAIIDTATTPGYLTLKTT